MAEQSKINQGRVLDGVQIDDVLPHRDAAPFHEILDNAQQLTAEIDRLQAQLAAQQAVIDAAREVLNTITVGRSEGWFHWTAGSCLDELREAFLALDVAQAAQPEGEPR